MKHYAINWKTTLAGTLVLACVGLYFGGIIDKEQLTVGIGVLMGAGLIVSKDSK
jgi:hypothetical protein